LNIRTGSLRKEEDMAEVVLKNVSKIYKGGVTGVKDISLKVEDGEFFVLLGPSGCGKSTTLRLIGGLEKANSGEIYIGEDFVNFIPPKDRNIAFVFQNYALYPHMTVYENMSFALKLRRYSKEEIDRRVREAADILGLTPLLNRKPKALSGGQRQRVALGRAIVRKPSVFLFDEPLSNLDAKLRVQMRTELKKLHSRLGATMIYVTHDQVEAMSLAERICVLKDGVVQQIDSPLDIYNDPKNMFVAGFVGSPQMNFLKCKVKIKDEKIILDKDGIEINLVNEKKENLENFIGKEVILGIRPENIYDRIYISNPYEIGSVITTTVEVAEMLGNEILAYLTMDNNRILARFPSSSKLKIGDEIAVVLDTTKAKVFSTEGERIV